MPTNHPRYTITGDPEVEAIVERRKRSYPDFSISKLLAFLVKKGDEAVSREQQEETLSEKERYAAARRLAARFRRPDGFDHDALGEASELWLSR
jgi:hypothetical protein